MIKAGKGATREIKDYHLTRFACYLTAMNGDPEKEEIAQAQTYFALKTYEAEQQSLPHIQQISVREVEERLQRLEQEVAALSQVGQRPRLASTTRKSVPASEEEVRAKVTKQVLAFLQRQEEPVSRRTITKYGHSCIAIIEPILDELVASRPVSRIKIPGSRVQWFSLRRLSVNMEIPWITFTFGESGVAEL